MTKTSALTLSSAVQHSAKQRLRIAFVNTHPIQYFAPMYAYLTAEGGIDVTALYLSDISLRGATDGGFKRAVKWDIDLLSGYDAFFAGERAQTRKLGGFFSMIGPELWAAIRNGRFDAVVVHGHNLACHHMALWAARTSHTPVFLRGETHLGLSRPGWKDAIRKPLVRELLRNFSGALAIGSANARYYESMGVPQQRIFKVPYAIDNRRFAAQADLAPGAREAILDRLGLSKSRPVVLFAAKFDERKRPEDLIRAYALFRRRGHDAQLAMVGSGVLEGALRSLVESEQVPDVVFPGFQNQTQLPAIYAACDVFVLPSVNEPWGLAVNEAMAAGSPVIVSREIGCAEDLVEDGINGRVFDARDIVGLADALGDVLADPIRSRAMGDASRARISCWSYRECGEGLRQAVATVQAKT